MTAIQTAPGERARALWRRAGDRAFIEACRLVWQIHEHRGEEDATVLYRRLERVRRIEAWCDARLGD